MVPWNTVIILVAFLQKRGFGSQSIYLWETAGETFDPSAWEVLCVWSLLGGGERKLIRNQRANAYDTKTVSPEPKAMCKCVVLPDNSAYMSDIQEQQILMVEKPGPANDLVFFAR